MQAMTHSVAVTSDLARLLPAERERATLAERRRFSEELHDVVASNLQPAILYLEQAKQHISPHEREADRAIEAAQEYIRNCWSSARRSAAALRPAELEQRGLIGSLQHFVERLNDASEVPIRFNISGGIHEVPREAELGLLRIAQEAVTNALRHAAPEAVSVELAFDDDAIRLEVIDNGIGFDPEMSCAGSGLLNIRERANELGAYLSIDSGPGRGAHVGVSLTVSSSGLTHRFTDFDSHRPSLNGC